MLLKFDFYLTKLVGVGRGILQHRLIAAHMLLYFAIAICHLLLTLGGAGGAIAGFATSALLSVELKTSPYCFARTSS